MFAARLRAYAPGGAALGLLPDPLSWQASIVHGDLGALSVTYSTLSAGGPLIARPLDDGLEVAVEVWDGATWVEPRGCRFVRVAQGSDQADDMQVYTVTFRAWGWLLTNAPLIAGTFTDGRRYFVAPKAGSLVGTVLAENAADGGVPVTVIGGGTTDAGSASWPTLPDQNFEYGADALGIVRGLQEAGALDWATQARGLYLYLPDSAALSPDLSGTVRLRLGRDIGQAPADETIEGLLSGVAVRAQAGGTVVVDEPTAPVPWGKWRRLLSIGQVDNQAAAEAMGQAELERSGRARQQYTRDLVLHDAAPIPLVDYWPGAWIMAPTSVPAESVRVQQVTLTFGDGGFGGNVVLNDRLVEGDIRRARTLATLAGGQVGSGGAPAPIVTDPEASRVPSTPTGLARTAALSFTGPTPRGVVTISWNAVTTATDTGPLTLAGYDVQWSIDGGAWQERRTSETSLQVTDLTPGVSLVPRVRARGARTTLPSAWATGSAITVPGDVTAPGVPTTPTAASALRVVSITWAGTLSAAIPADFKQVEVALGTTTTPTAVVGTLDAAGTLQVGNQTIGQTLYARLRSVDTTGNTSAWSTASAPIVVAGVKGPDLEANSVTANTIAVGALDGKIVTGATIRTAASGDRVELSGSSLKSIVGSTTAVEMISSGINIYQSGSLQAKYVSGRTAFRMGPIDADWWGMLAYADVASFPDLFRAYYNTTTATKAVYVGHESNPANFFHVWSGTSILDSTGSSDVLVRAIGTGGASLQSRPGGDASPVLASVRAQNGGQVVLTSRATSNASTRAELTLDNNSSLILATYTGLPGAETASGALQFTGSNVYLDAYAAALWIESEGVTQVVGGSGIELTTNTGTLQFFVNNARKGYFNSSGFVLDARSGTGGVTARFTNPGGRLVEDSSSIRYKQDVEDHQVDLEAMLALRPRSWRAKDEVAIDPDTTNRYAGLIAEEVHDLGLVEFVAYDPDGTPKALAYDRMVIGLVQLAQQQAARIAALENPAAKQVSPSLRGAARAAVATSTSSGEVVAMPQALAEAPATPARAPKKERRAPLRLDQNDPPAHDNDRPHPNQIEES